MAFTKQAIGEVGAKKTGGAGHNDTHSQKYRLNGSEASRTQAAAITAIKSSTRKISRLPFDAMAYTVINGLLVLSFLDW